MRVTTPCFEQVFRVFIGGCDTVESELLFTVCSLVQINCTAKLVNKSDTLLSCNHVCAWAGKDKGQPEVLGRLVNSLNPPLQCALPFIVTKDSWLFALGVHVYKHSYGVSTQVVCQSDTIQGLCWTLRGWHFLCEALAYIPHLPSRVCITGTMSRLVSTPLPLNTCIVCATSY